MSTTTSVATPLSSMEQVIQRISDLQTAMQTRSPGYEFILKTIHKNLQDDPDTVNLLTPEQIGVIVAALSQNKGIVLGVSAGKNKTSSGKRLSSLGLDDLME